MENLLPRFLSVLWFSFVIFALRRWKLKQYASRKAAYDEALAAGSNMQQATQAGREAVVSHKSAVKVFWVFCDFCLWFSFVPQEANEAAAAVKAEAKEAAAAEKAAAKKAAAEKAAAEEAAAKKAAAEQRKQRFDFLREKQTAEGKLQGAESKELAKLRDAMNKKKRRKEELPEDKEERLKKMSKYNQGYDRGEVDFERVRHAYSRL